MFELSKGIRSNLLGRTDDDQANNLGLPAGKRLSGSIRHVTQLTGSQQDTLVGDLADLRAGKGDLLNTSDTVVRDTPARSATS